MNTNKRGRPRRFKFCPVCGADALREYGVFKSGHCTSVYCLCASCGERIRLVSPGDSWFRVRTASLELKKPSRK